MFKAFRFFLAASLMGTAGLAGPALAGEQAWQPLQFAPPAGMMLTNMQATNGLMLRVPNSLAPKYLEQVVPYKTAAKAGTIIVDTGHKFLYFVLGEGRAIRYGIGTARTGFTWGGVHKITRKAKWPTWTPPAEMLARQPGIPHFMKGGINNPLGARALYIGKTLYRIHGTNQPATIGHDVSSGCIRMTNASVEDLYSRVKIGSTVIVL